MTKTVTLTELQQATITAALLFFSMSMEAEKGETVPPPWQFVNEVIGACDAAEIAELIDQLA